MQFKEVYPNETVEIYTLFNYLFELFSFFGFNEPKCIRIIDIRKR